MSTRCQNPGVLVSGTMTESAQPVASSQPVVKARSPVVRGIYFVLGLICLGFAYLSFLPGIPTFDFVILAAFFFARSSDRFHNWLVNHRVFGRIIHAYRAGGLTVRTKVIACVGIVASISFSAIVLVDNTILRTIMALAALYGIWFVLSRPTRRDTSSADVEPA